jgi:hypothetical protein
MPFVAPEYCGGIRSNQIYFHERCANCTSTLKAPDSVPAVGRANNISFAIAAGFGLQCVCVKSTCWRMGLLSSACGRKLVISGGRFSESLQNP